MTRSQLNPTRAYAPDAKLVQSAKRLLQRIAAAGDREMAWYLFEILMDRVERSMAYTDAAFAATRALRNSNVIKPAQAVWIFHTLWELWKSQFQNTDPEVACEKTQLKVEARRRWNGASRSEIDAALDEYIALLKRAGRKMMAAFYRARGEEALGALSLSHPEEYDRMWAQGFSIIGEKRRARPNTQQ